MMSSSWAQAGLYVVAVMIILYYTSRYNQTPMETAEVLLAEPRITALLSAAWPEFLLHFGRMSTTGMLNQKGCGSRCNIALE